jgi:hypothetical protein
MKIMSVSAGDEYIDEGSINNCFGKRNPRGSNQNAGDCGG